MAPRCTQDGPRWPENGMVKRPARGLQDGRRPLQNVLQEGPKARKPLGPIARQTPCSPKAFETHSGN
eukprot:6079863-Pyramimonas_sp.AAC.1